MEFQMDNNSILERLLNKQDAMNRDVEEIKLSVQYHIKRTDLLEESVKLNREENKALFAKIDEELKPLKSQAAISGAVLKVIGGLSLILSMLASVAKILGYLA